MRDTLLAAARHAKLRAKLIHGKYRVRFPKDPGHRLPVRYVVGCGRSGTTVLGRMLALHPRVCYLFEPYHLWSIIDPRMDVTGLFTDPDGAKWFFDEGDVNPQARARYEALIARAGDARRNDVVIEKLPHNACRIGWIITVEPEARLIHIVRDGVDVVRSIQRLAERSDYRLLFRNEYNQWWGERDAKWRALSQEGPDHGYVPGEVDLLRSHSQRAAYEWVVSLGEVDRHRSTLGNRLFELRYADLVADTQAACRKIAAHFDFAPDAGWIDRASQLITGERKNEGTPLILPPQMCELFNAYQVRFGFEGRAMPMSEGEER
jgi:hypothetical protein